MKTKIVHQTNLDFWRVQKYELFLWLVEIVILFLMIFNYLAYLVTKLI